MPTDGCPAESELGEALTSAVTPSSAVFPFITSLIRLAELTVSQKSVSCVCVCVCVCVHLGTLFYTCGQVLCCRVGGHLITQDGNEILCSLVLVVRLLSPVRLFATPWTAARQASLSFTISRSLLKLLSIESEMPSNHLVLCRPLLLLSSVFPSIRVFSNESFFRIK